MTKHLYIAKVWVKSYTRTKVRQPRNKIVDGHKAGTRVHNSKRNCLICVIPYKLDKTNVVCANVYRHNHCPILYTRRRLTSNNRFRYPLFEVVFYDMPKLSKAKVTWFKEKEMINTCLVYFICFYEEDNYCS